MAGADTPRKPSDRRPVRASALSQRATESVARAADKTLDKAKAVRLEAESAISAAKRAQREAAKAIQQIDAAGEAFQALVKAQALAVSKDSANLPLVLRVDRSAIRHYSSLEHEATPERRALVQLWSMAGASKSIIARELGITVQALNKHYDDELTDALERGVALVQESLLAKAIGGDMTAIALFLKVKGREFGWIDRSAKEQQELNVNVQLDVIRSLTAIASAAKHGRTGEAGALIEHAPDDYEEAGELL